MARKFFRKTLETSSAHYDQLCVSCGEKHEGPKEKGVIVVNLDDVLLLGCPKCDNCNTFWTLKCIEVL